jgi:site-specific DNA-methyltransferase (adenine-specific)
LSFAQLVSPQTPFGLLSSFKDYHETPIRNSIACHTVNGLKYIKSDQVHKNRQWINGEKVYISKSYGERGPFPYLFLARPFVGKSMSCCTQTYLMIGPTKSAKESRNIIQYISTRLFRFLIMLKKNTQDAMRGVYEFVPMQDFSEPWTDEKLYEKYGITAEEIAFIESMIRPMDITANADNNADSDDNED